MKALLLVAHGSRLETANEEIRDLTARLAEAAEAQYGDVRTGFLELAEPSIPDGIRQCIDAGADEVVVVPYFLAAGRHVTKDIPAAVQHRQEQYPAVRMRIAVHFGALPGVTDLLLAAARESPADG